MLRLCLLARGEEILLSSLTEISIATLIDKLGLLEVLLVPQILYHVSQLLVRVAISMILIEILALLIFNF